MVPFHLIPAHHPRRSPNFFLGATRAPHPLSPKSHGIISFADPHPLNSVVSYRYKNHSGAGASFPSQTSNLKSLTSLFATDPKNPPITPLFATDPNSHNSKPFNCHTCETPGVADKLLIRDLRGTATPGCVLLPIKETAHVHTQSRFAL